jgi:hypothetical protein
MCRTPDPIRVPLPESSPVDFDRAALAQNPCACARLPQSCAMADEPAPVGVPPGVESIFLTGKPAHSAPT